MEWSSGSSGSWYVLMNDADEYLTQVPCSKVPSHTNLLREIHRMDVTVSNLAESSQSETPPLSAPLSVYIVRSSYSPNSPNIPTVQYQCTVRWSYSG